MSRSRSWSTILSLIFISSFHDSKFSRHSSCHLVCDHALLITARTSFENVIFFHSFNSSRYFWCFVDMISLDHTFSKFDVFNVRLFSHNKEKCRSKSQKNKWFFLEVIIMIKWEFERYYVEEFKICIILYHILLIFHHFNTLNMSRILIFHCEDENFIKHNLITFFQATLIRKIIFKIRRESVQLHDHYLRFDNLIKKHKDY